MNTKEHLHYFLSQVEKTINTRLFAVNFGPAIKLEYNESTIRGKSYAMIYVTHNGKLYRLYSTSITHSDQEIDPEFYNSIYLSFLGYLTFASTYYQQLNYIDSNLINIICDVETMIKDIKGEEINYKETIKQT